MLAAGGSRHLGTPRQLLELRGEPLVRRAARAAVEAGLWPVVVAVGDHTEEVRAALAGLPVVTVSSASVPEGASCSLRLGLERLAECSPAAVGVVVLMFDQPAVRASHLRALAAARCKERPLVASSYAGSLGMPALFPVAVFPELRALGADAGCAQLLARHAAQVAPVALHGGELHVNTPEDWARAQRLGLDQV